MLYGIAVVALHISFVDDKVMGLSLKATNINTQYLFWLMLFPILLFISYLTFLRAEKSFSKHLISLIYVATSLFIALTILNDVIIVISDDKLAIWAFALFVSLVFLWNSRVFTTRKKYIFILLNTLIQMALFVGVVGGLAWITR